MKEGAPRFRARSGRGRGRPWAPLPDSRDSSRPPAGGRGGRRDRPPSRRRPPGARRRAAVVPGAPPGARLVAPGRRRLSHPRPANSLKGRKGRQDSLSIGRFLRRSPEIENVRQEDRNGPRDAGRTLGARNSIGFRRDRRGNRRVRHGRSDRAVGGWSSRCRSRALGRHDAGIHLGLGLRTLFERQLLGRGLSARPAGRREVRRVGDHVRVHAHARDRAGGARHAWRASSWKRRRRKIPRWESGEWASD